MPVSATRSERSVLSVVRTWLAGGALPPVVHVVLGLILPVVVLCANMWAVHRFTVDDAYISFRYARNLVDGHGLVYNPGEYVEGYTNFLWTVLVAAGMKLGVDPLVTSKVLGAAAAIGTLVAVYALSRRLSPLRQLPCIATWLLASSSTFSGYAVFGLETAGFIALVVTATLLMFREHDDPRAFPWSGLVFALAGLTRPEAPMFIGIPMLLLGRGIFARQNLLRAALFAGPVLAHLLWRHSYYGTWTPATLAAKTGDLAAQIRSGRNYVADWMAHTGPVVFFALYGLGLAISRRQRELATVVALFAGICVYVVLVGGDWMSFFRFMAPAEPWAALASGVAIRELFATRDRAAWIALVLFGAWMVPLRITHLEQAHRRWLGEEKKFWDTVAGQTADWLARNEPGLVAIGDIGYVGYRTNYPLLDLLGLVDPVIGNLPGGYTRKLGAGYKKRVFGAKPKYIVIVMAGQACDRATMAGSRMLFGDPRFRRHYRAAHNVQVGSGASWCIFERKPKS